MVMSYSFTVTKLAKGGKMKKLLFFKKHILMMFLMMVGLFFIAGPVSATFISFGDTAIYWPGYSATNDTYGPDNTRDVIGDPSLTGGQIEIIAGKIKSIGISGKGYTINGGPLSGLKLASGDLFLSIDGDTSWDYVVRTYPGVVTGDVSGQKNVYSVAIPLSNSGSYLMTGNDVTSPWAGYDIRNQHPYALNYDPSSFFGTAQYSGLVESGLTKWTFDTPITVTGDIYVGWTVSCANDVIYEKVPSTPEPATLMLMGFGSGFMGYGINRLRRKTKKKKEVVV
jgi:hypothetical protein